MEKTPNGVVRINLLSADFEGVGGLFHKMHCGVHIAVQGEAYWNSGPAESSGHKCQWKGKHCDISSRYPNKILIIQGIDYFKDNEHGQLIGEVEIYLTTFLSGGEHTIEVFHKEKLGNSKKVGVILVTSELFQSYDEHIETLFPDSEW